MRISQASLTLSLSLTLSSHVLHNIIHTLHLNMRALLSLQLWTYRSQQDVGGDGDEQGEESVDG